MKVISCPMISCSHAEEDQVVAAKLTASRNDDDAISGAWPHGVTIFLRGRDCHRAPLLAPCHGGVPRSGVRTMRGVVFINNQPASARHHAKDERHVPTPAQCEASSSSIANRCPREHRHARRSVVGWSLYIVPNLGGALPSSVTAIIDNASSNTAAACAVVGDVYIVHVVRIDGRCLSAHRSAARGGLLHGVR